MRSAAKWARENAEITFVGTGLVFGNYRDMKFRIFVDEKWAGVIGPGGKWDESRACYDLYEFKKAIGCKPGQY
jgi:hypothetical protein